jgi:hypothetical protein
MKRWILYVCGIKRSISGSCGFDKRPDRRLSSDLTIWERRASRRMKLLLSAWSLHLGWRALTLVGRWLHLLWTPGHLRLHHPAIILLLLLSSQWSLRVPWYLREWCMHWGIPISTIHPTSVIIIVTVGTYINLHPSVTDRWQQLMLLILHGAYCPSHVELISLRLWRDRVKHQATLSTMMRTAPVKLVNIWEHRGLPKVTCLILDSHASIGRSSLWGGTVLWVLSLQNSVHVFEIDRHSASWCPLPIARVCNNGIASIAVLSHCELLWTLRVLRSLL